MLTDTYLIVDMLTEYLEDIKGSLGIEFIGSFGERRIPAYPAIVVVPGTKEKEIHATQTFQVLSVVDMYVYHGDLTQTKRERSREDLITVANLESALERDYEWRTDINDSSTRQIIFGYVASEEPGILQPRTDKSSMIISTKIQWRGLTQRRFGT